MINTIIFDFDGTIINTNTLIEKGLNYFSMKYRNRRFSKEEMKSLAGKTLEDQMAAISSNNAGQLADEFREWYQIHHNAETNAFPGMINMLKFINRLNLKLAIVTNNSRASLEMGLDHLNIKDLFHMTLTRDDVSTTKPHPEGLHKILETFGIEAHEAVFIGDTDNDIHAAKAAGIKNILVGWSILDSEMVRLLNPDFIMETPSDLLEIIINSALAA